MKNTFSDCLDGPGMDEAVENLPDSVEAMYAKILTERIYHHPNKKSKDKARLIFIWLAYSIRPLTLRELACAASLPDPRKVLEICTSSLVNVSRRKITPRRSAWDVGRSVNKYEDIVEFDHFSVQEYLKSERLLALDETAFFYEPPLLAHLTIAEISVTHLLQTNKVDLTGGYFSERDWPARNVDESLWSEFPLLDYSTFWYQHAWAADAIESSMIVADFTQPDCLRSRIHGLFCEFQSIKNWLCLLQVLAIQWYEGSRLSFYSRRWIVESPLSPEFLNSPLLVASLLNLPDNTRRLLEQGVSVDGNSNAIDKPVLIAAVAGNLAVLRLLLENNASLEQSELDNVTLKNERHGATVLSIILDTRPRLAIKYSTVLMSARNFKSKEMLKYILDTPGLVTLTETLLMGILGRCSRLSTDDELLGRFLSYGNDMGCDSLCMLKIFLRESSCGRNIKLVIDRYKPPPSTSQEVVRWVINNRIWGVRMLPAILEYYEDIEIDLSQDMLVTAASNRCLKTLLFWTVLRHNRSVVITKYVMDSIASQDSRSHFPPGVFLMNMLVGHESCGIKNFEGTRNRQRMEYVESHMETCKTKISEQMRKAALRWEPDAIAFLQAHARPNVTIIGTIAETASSSSDTRQPPAIVRPSVRNSGAGSPTQSSNPPNSQAKFCTTYSLGLAQRPSYISAGIYTQLYPKSQSTGLAYCGESFFIKDHTSHHHCYSPETSDLSRLYFPDLLPIAPSETSRYGECNNHHETSLTGRGEETREEQVGLRNTCR